MNYINWKITSTGIVLTLFSLLNLAGSNPEYVKNQMIFMLIGWALFFFTIWKGYKLFRLNNLILFLLFFALLIFTHFFGENIRGSTRWIKILGVNIQSSEFIKIGFIGVIASMFSKKQYLPFSLFLQGFIIALVVSILILKQPDLGNSLVVMAIFLFMSYYAGLSFKKIVGMFVLFILVAPFFWFRMAEFQRARIISFINPEQYSQTIGYNMIQSVITTGSGGFWGKGLGRGTQTINNFLPESHTDFAFASLSEQFGFIGGGIVIVSYVVILVSSFMSLYRQKDRFLYLVISGIAGYFFVHCVINIGMNMGLLPVTGIVLPLVSYGGSSIITAMVLLGILNVSSKKD